MLSQPGMGQLSPLSLEKMLLGHLSPMAPLSKDIPWGHLHLGTTYLRKTQVYVIC